MYVLVQIKFFLGHLVTTLTLRVQHLGFNTDNFTRPCGHTFASKTSLKTTTQCTKAGFDLTTRNSAGGDFTTRPHRQGQSTLIENIGGATKHRNLYDKA
jgi:hypothetical protein